MPGVLPSAQWHGPPRVSRRHLWHRSAPVLPGGVQHRVEPRVDRIEILWQPSDTHVFVLAGPFRLAAYAGMFIAIAVFIWGALALRGVDLFGLAAIKADLRKTTQTASEFVIRGPYVWVRHSWYAAAIVLIWSCVDLTADRLLFNVLWTVWIAITVVRRGALNVSVFRQRDPRVPPRFRACAGRSSSDTSS